MGLIELVRGYSCTIRNDRSPGNVFDHLRSEVLELWDEIENVEQGRPEGEDGIVGEAMDVINCALDIIYLHRPDLNVRELTEIMTEKCEKWRRKASQPIAN